MTVEIYSIEPLAQDVLRVTGAVDGVEYIVSGWQSAIVNHYDETAYKTDADGNVTRDPSALPRPMTTDEVRAYCEGLFAGIAPAEAAPAVASALSAVKLDARPVQEEPPIEEPPTEATAETAPAQAEPPVAEV